MPEVCDEISWHIEPGTHPYLICELDPDEVVVAEAGSMVWLGEDIVMETKMGDGRGRKKGLPFSGLVQAIGRKLTDEDLFFTHFRNTGPMTERVALTCPIAGSVVPVDMGAIGGQRLLCQKGAFLAAAHGTKISWEVVSSLSGGLFGGEGWVLQQIQGDGMVFLSASGSVIEKDLGHGEQIRVDTGSILGWTSGCKYSVKMVRGISSMMFGEEGLFLTTLTGPGRIYIQTMPIQRAALALFSALPVKKK